MNDNPEIKDHYIPVQDRLITDDREGKIYFAVRLACNALADQSNLLEEIQRRKMFLKCKYNENQAKNKALLYYIGNFYDMYNYLGRPINCLKNEKLDFHYKYMQYYIICKITQPSNEDINTAKAFKFDLEYQGGKHTNFKPGIIELDREKEVRSILAASNLSKVIFELGTYRDELAAEEPLFLEMLPKEYKTQK